MTVVYSTVTSKGQITLPVDFRRALSLEPGLRVAITLDGDRVVISGPPKIDATRAALRRAAEAAGTWAKPYQAGDGWRAAVQGNHGQS
ncbi:MAG: AbrB/MazE/SpoVT family DNA-binding domain-containing protein [Bifidobacteriaceae bacterium]|jgi:AbrB family looped-hinge helix DNA binding protein|nr:AbrB/MazE/SpoVT family DNA-binding domain-containing protein [Bifidobacteriaceae bacterium]